MLAQLSPSFESKEVFTFADNLTKLQIDRKKKQRSHWGRIQIRDGVRDEVDSFCVAQVQQRNPVLIAGHIAGAGGKSAEFDIHAEADSDRVLIRIRSETLAVYDRAKAYREIVNAVKKMMDKAAIPLQGGGGGNEKKGFYLVNAGESGTVGDAAKVRFQEAIRARVIPPGFDKSCLKFGFKMTYYKGR